MTIIQYKIIYNDMFYDSMFYRAMAGYSGTDIGQSTNDGIPGLADSGSGTLDNYQAMPGWNLTHFKMVYRTAYFNPYPQDQLTGHSKDWRAVNLEDVIALKEQIDDGTIEGTVDTSASALYTAGAVFLKYYDGAFVNGTLTTEEGYPVAGVRVTILDEWGIPHGSAFTDAQGHYSVLSPFGEVTLAFTTGALEGLTQTGETAITTIRFNVTDDQAMRRPYDLDLDGVYDYIITKDYVMPGTQITADIFWDVNKDGNFTSGTDLLVNNTEIQATELFSGQEFTINAVDGTFDTKLPAGQYDFVATVLGRDLQVASGFNVTGTKTETKLAIQPSVLSGRVTNVDGSAASGLSIEMLDLTSGVSAEVKTDSEGNYSFPLLLAGRYSMITTEPGYVLFNLQANISEGQTLARNITIFPSSQVTARITNSGAQTSYATWMLVNNYNPLDVISGITDQFGNIELRVPKGLWTLYGSQSSATDLSAGAILIDTTVETEVKVFLDLLPAATVSGTALSDSGLVLTDAYVTFVFANGARMQIITDSIAAFKLALPEGTYDVMVNSISKGGLFSGAVTVALPQTTLRIRLTEGVTLSGTIWLLKDVTEIPSVNNLGRFANIEITDPSSRIHTVQADSEGAYSVMVPKGSTVSISTAEPGYTEWSTDVMIARATSDFVLTADPDPVTVSGRLTSEEVGIRGVQIAFVPDDAELETLTATTGADGIYSIDVPPAKYTVSVDQITNPAGGEKYLFSQAQIITPSAATLPLDIAVTKKVEAFGNVLGGATGIRIVLSGPEERTLDLTSANYSVLLLPGVYEVYATGTVSGQSFAEMTVLEISAATRRNDISLERAFAVTGTITIPTGAPMKAVTVRATASDGTFVGVMSTSSGRYALSLPSGDYVISYLLEDSFTQAGHVSFIEYSGEQAVQVVSSDVVADAALPRLLDNTTFSGRIVGPEGQALQAAVQMISHGVYGQNITFTSDASGAFNVSLQPGDYVLYAVRLQDKHAALAVVSFSRNIPRLEDIVLADGRYISGRVTIGGVGVGLPLKLSTATVTLDIRSDSAGNFQLLAPPENYTLASSTQRTERGITVSYSASDRFAVGSSDVFVLHALTRETKRGVIATWNTSAVQSAGVGSTVSYAITITNTGNVADRFLVTFTGTGFNVTFTPSQVEVNFGSENMAIVIAEVSPLSTVASGNQTATCLVRSLDFATTRTDFSLFVQVLPQRGVLVRSLNTSAAVGSLTTVTSFTVNNTGNTGDDLGVEITNLAILKSLGWNAVIVDPSTSEETSSVYVAAFGSKSLQVKYTALRADADASAQATVFAYSKNMTTANAYSDIPIIVPDLTVGKGDLSVTRDDISLENDAAVRLATNVGLLIALVSLLVTFYILRRRKGYGRSGKGGAKK
jgi:dolichyl-diphosphooligosaccharide--protein glycosyltransferase